MVNTISNRKLYIDQGKGIGIFIVLLGHFYTFSEQYHTFINELIYLFHMPLFFFLSGVVTKMVVNDKELLIKKVTRLLIPFAFWFVFYIFYTHSTWSAVFDKMKLGVWYLQALFLFGIVHMAYSWIASKINMKNQWSVDIAFGVFIYIMIKVVYHVCMWAPIDLNGLLGNIHFVNFWPYFFIGMLMKKHQLMEKGLKASLMPIVYLIMSVVGVICIIGYKMGFFLFDMAVVMSIIMLILSVLERFGGGNKILAKLGEHSSAIYVVHYAFILKLIDFFDKHQLITHSHVDFISFFVLSILLCLLCIFIERLIGMNRWARRIMFGY